MDNFDVYRDIEARTGGEIYIGVVGPVRTGKSTFIKRFMELLVLPAMEDENLRTISRDELPQSAAGKTIMTTEPKFIPKEAAKITLEDGIQAKVRLIDCVGFMVDGAAGHVENGEERLVKTPWFDHEIPFTQAAELGTRKVIGAQKKVIIEDEEPNSIMFVSKNKAGDEIIRIMNDRSQMRFHDPNAPRFLLTDQKGKFALGIGGYVRATAEYDFNGIVNDVDFYPALIPQRGSGNFAKNQFQMDITTSTLFLKLVGRTKHLGDFVVYTAGNFRGDGKTFELQNAYAQFLGFTIGYSYGSFMDLSALPPTIDFAGPNGSAFYRTTQLSYMCDKLKNWKFGVSMEMPSVDGTTNNDLSINTQRMPDFATSVQYNWNSNSHIKLGAIIRSMTYSSNVHEKAYSATGFGLQASTTFNITKKLQAYGQFNYGKGIGSYLNDLSNLNVDIVPDPDKEGKMQVLPMLGWYAGLQYNLCPSIFISGTYSLSRLYSENGYPSENPESYRKGQYLVANAFWNVSSNLQVGVEYLRGWRTDFSSATRHANRLNMLVQYSF